MTRCEGIKGISDYLAMLLLDAVGEGVFGRDMGVFGVVASIIRGLLCERCEK